MRHTAVACTDTSCIIVIEHVTHGTTSQSQMLAKLARKGEDFRMENTEHDEPMVLSVMEAAAMLRLSRVSAYNMVRQGVIPSIRFGRRLVVPRKALMDLLNGSSKVGR